MLGSDHRPVKLDLSLPEFFRQGYIDILSDKSFGEISFSFMAFEEINKEVLQDACGLQVDKLRFRAQFHGNFLHIDG